MVFRGFPPIPLSIVTVAVSTVCGALASTTFGEGDVTGQAPPRFVQTAGAMEFSGRVIVRPIQPPELSRIDPRSGHRQIAEARARLVALNAEYVPEVDEYIVAVPPGKDENSFAAELLATGWYEFVQPDWILYPVGRVEPNDPLFADQWHLNKIAAPEAWHISPGRPAFTIAIVDTGVDTSHPDLAPVLVLGYNSHILQRRSEANGGIVTDANGHGTAVAGVAAAAGNNGVGGSGVGWNLRVMPIRATNPATSSGGASFSDLQNGALWSSNNGARIINISYVGVAEPAVQALGNTLRSRGCLLVWPMDDNNVNYATSFDHPAVLVVSGSDAADLRYPASSFGAGVDVAAPAVSIWTTTRGGGYGLHNGNSFAGPIVCGAAAVVWSVAPTLSPAQIERLLIDGADDIGEPGEDDAFGAGRINLRWSVWLGVVRQYLAGVAPGPHNAAAFGLDDLYDLSANPRDVNADAVADERDIAAAAAYLRRGEGKSLYRSK